MVNPSRASYTCAELTVDSSAIRSTVLNLNMKDGTDPAYLVDLIKALQQKEGNAPSISINIQILSRASELSGFSNKIVGPITDFSSLQATGNVAADDEKRGTDATLLARA
jgi:hypothetical protein